MEEKKEVQQTILKKEPFDEISEEEFYAVLKIVSPGTNLRSALDGVIRAGKGGLIVIENEITSEIIDGGFRVNCKFTPQKLIELCKMDGAIVLSSDLKRINYANTLLVPNVKLKTNETGTRHKAAERTARHMKGIAIAVSERKNEITLFYKNKKYKIRETSEVLRKANEYIQILERQRELFDSHLENLNKHELKNYVSLNHSIKAIQKGKVIQKISKELSKYLIELGNEGSLLKARLREILYDVERETNLIIKDYSNIDPKKSVIILDELSYEELLEKEKILSALDYKESQRMVSVPGWRILSKTSLSDAEIAKVVKEIGMDKVLATDIKNNVEVLPEDKFTLLKVELERIKLGL